MKVNDKVNERTPMARVTRMGGVMAEAKSSQERGKKAHERTPMARVEGVGGVKADRQES